MNWLTQAPILYGVLGSVISAIIMIMVMLRFGPFQSVALKGLVEIQRESINAHERALAAQKAHCDSEIVDLKCERDDYRNKLHDEKQLSQKYLLDMTELKGRPDFSDLKKMLDDHSQILRDIMRAFDEHAKADQTVFERITATLDQVSKALPKAI